MHTEKKILSFFRPIHINFFKIIIFLLTLEGIIFSPSFAKEKSLKTFLLADERPSAPDRGEPEDKIANRGTTRASTPPDGTPTGESRARPSAPDMGKPEDKIANGGTTRAKAPAKAPPNGTPTPPGESRPGTTRDPETCQETDSPLTAIFANQGNDFTVSEYPTFWFYIPYAAEDIKLIEFLLKNSDNTKTIYRTTVQLTQQSGIIKVTIPSIPEYFLKVNQDYRWRLNLDCNSDSQKRPLAVHGWIRRVPNNIQLASQKPVTLDRYLVYRNNNIWYDAITELAENRFANPNNPELAQAWDELLNELNYNDIISEPFVESQQIAPPEI